jgi:hypothetical protein
VGISIGSCHQNFTEKLQMRRVGAKFVPRLLADDPQLSGKDLFQFPKLKTTLKGRRFQSRKMR